MKIWILLGFFFLCSCATMTDQGYEALEAGRTEEALAIFQKLATKKMDSRALEGLRKAEQQWLDRKLIDVRLLRLGQNWGASELLLKEIILKQNQWQSFPTGAAYSTQMEEIGYFSTRIKERITQALKEKNPLWAQSEFNQHQFILNRALAENTSGLQIQIYKEAKEFCAMESKLISATDYFKQIWLEKTCQIWDIQIKQKNTRSSVKFFKKLIPKLKIENLEPRTTEILSTHLLKSFQQSRWYKENGTYNLDFEINANFVSSVKENLVHRTAYYFVDVPYEDTFKRVRNLDQKKNDSILGAFISLLLVGSPSERVSDNGDGTETVHVTKYRKEERTYPYSAFEVQAKKILSGTIIFSLDKESLKYEINESWQLIEDRHKENFRDAGLAPNSPHIPTDEQWIASLGDTLVQKLTQTLQIEWINRFCQVSGMTKNSEVSVDEQAHRCGYQVTGPVPEVLNQYYLERWKISFSDYNALLAANSKETRLN